MLRLIFKTKNSNEYILDYWSHVINLFTDKVAMLKESKVAL